MQIRAPSALIGLQAEESLRIESGTAVQVSCLSGVLWITREGDPTDGFVAAGQSVRLTPRGLTLLTALQPALLRVQDPPRKRNSRPWLQAFTRARQTVRSLALGQNRPAVS